MAEKRDFTLQQQPKLGNRRTGAEDPTNSRPRFDLAQADCHRCDAAIVPVFLPRATTQSGPCSSCTTTTGRHALSRQRPLVPYGVHHRLFHRPHPSEHYSRISCGTPYRRLGRPLHAPKWIWYCGSPISPHGLRLLRSFGGAGL